MLGKPPVKNPSASWQAIGPPQKSSKCPFVFGEGGQRVKGLLNNVQKNCTFLKWGHPLVCLTLSYIVLHCHILSYIVLHFLTLKLKLYYIDLNFLLLGSDSKIKSKTMRYFYNLREKLYTKQHWLHNILIWANTPKPPRHLLIAAVLINFFSVESLDNNFCLIFVPTNFH